MNGLWRRPVLALGTLAGLAVLFTVGAGSAGMPPPSLLEPASPPSAAPACSIKVPDPEPPDLTSLAGIPADKALAAALAAYPGSRVRALALENDNGCLIYRVLLSNGLEVRVDAGTGQVLSPPAADEESEPDPEIQVK